VDGAIQYDARKTSRSLLRRLHRPLYGTGSGVQAELLLSYQASDALTFSVGGRYWGMWTSSAIQTNQTSNVFAIETDRYGLLVQASYKFRAPR
jgi:hypothetical protein